MYVQLVPLQHELTDKFCIRRCRIRRINHGEMTRETELWFQIDRSIVPPQYDDCDAYLLAVVMDAMKEKRDIEIKGTVSRQLVSNLVEYQAIWNKWLPKVYSQVEMKADYVKDDARRASGAVCAFSGGVDSTFSVWRHSQSKCSHRSQRLNFCSLVHGFDIPIEDEIAFNNASCSAQKVLDDIGIKLKPIKTNYRKISSVNWQHSFSCALAATLSNFKNDAGTCIIGSSEPYDSLVIPWGSTPIADHLLSSGEFVVMHDGASHSRTEKVKEISLWKAGRGSLRVCWEGKLKDRNCGACEKCVRTKLNFLAVQAPIPTCIPGSNIIDDLKKVTLKNDAIVSEYRQIYRYAISHNIEGPWVNKLGALLYKKSIIEKILFRGGGSKSKQVKGNKKTKRNNTTKTGTPTILDSL